MQQLFTDVIVRSETFLQRFAEQMYKKEPEVIRPTFEEEIKRAKELQRLAVANVATDKSEQERRKSGTTITMADLLEKQMKAQKVIMMMEKIKSRPLSHYYLWKVFQRVEKDPTRELIIPPLKTVIGS